MYFSKTQKAGDNTATDTELHLTGFGIPRVSRTEECLPESSCFMGKKKSDGENIGMHVKALNPFELQFGISINGTHWCGSRQAGSTLNRFLSWGGSQMLISVEHSILSPLRAILWLKICLLLRPASTAAWRDLWSSHGRDTFLTVVMKPHVSGGKELEPRRPALNYSARARACYNYVYFHESSTKQTKKLHIYKYKNMKWHELTSLV